MRADHVPLNRLHHFNRIPGVPVWISAAVLLALAGLPNPVQAQLRVDSTYTVDSLVNSVLLGSCVAVNNVKYRGSRSGIGYFNARNTNVGLEEGLIISTGHISNARGPNDNPGRSSEFGMPGDADLSAITTVPTLDAAVLEFDFVSSSDTVKFNYVFASEEYPEFVGQGYNDVFVFYVQGPGITGKKNIALIPNTSIPVTIDNVNGGKNAAYYVNNIGGSSVQYDGFTIPLEAKIGVIPGETYHMKIAIADAGDYQTDSGVFLEAGSFRSGERITIETIDDAVEGCRDGIVKISRKEDATDTLIVNLLISGNATQGIDYSAFPTSVTLLPGQFQTQFNIKAIQDMTFDPNERIIITLDNKCIGTDPSVDFMTILEDGLETDISADTSICRGSSAQLHARVLSGAPPYSYSWVPKTSLSDPAIATPVARPQTSTLYTVTIFDSYGCSTVRNVMVDVDDMKANAGNDIRICYGSAAQIGGTATGGAQPYTYSWFPPVGLSDDTASMPMASPLVTTSYIVEVRGAGGCIDRDTVIVTVGDRLELNAGNDTMICENSQAVLRPSISGGAGGYSYQWSPAASLNSTTSPAPVASPDVPTMYYVLATDSEGCSISDSIFVDINRVRASAGEDKQICAGASIVIGGNPRNGVPPYSYQWTPAANLTNPGAQYPVASPPVTTIYVVHVQDSYGCTSFDSVTVTVGDVISPVITPLGNTDICEGETVQLSATSGYDSYVWSNGASGPVITIDSTVMVTVTVTDNFGCSGTSAPIAVTSHPLPDPSIDGPNSVCRNSVVVYSADTDPGNAYSWSVAGGIIRAGQGTPQVTIEWTEYGTGLLQFREVAGATGCAGTVQYQVTVADALNPVVEADKPSPYCAGDTITLIAPAGYTVYRWNTGATTESIRAVAAGTYSVYVELDPQCTGTSAPVTIAFEPNPKPVITAPGSLIVCEGDSVTLDAGAGFQWYRWSNGASGRTVRIGEAGAYTVQVQNANGCIGTSDPAIVQIIPAPPQPVISRGIDTLYSTPAATYQWYRNDTLLAGATGSFYVMTLEGVYRVRITDGTGCASESEPFEVITPLATSTIALPSLEVSPGERFTLPVTIAASENLRAAGVTDFEMTLRFDATLMSPVDPSLVKSVAGSDLLLQLRGTLGADTLGILVSPEFIATLGAAERTDVRLEQFRWVNTFVRILPRHGEVRLKICREGGPRLFDDSPAVVLEKNHPNPFNASTTLSFTIIEQEHTELFVIDQLGRRAATLVSGSFPPGSYTARFDASELPSGVYVAVLRTPTVTRMRTMEVVK